AAAEFKRPQLVDLDRLAARSPERATELATRVEHVDAAILLVADENVAGELTEADRRARQAPGRIEHAALGEAPQQVSVRVEDIDEAVAQAAHIVLLGGVLLGVGHPDLAIDVLDAERRKAARDARVVEVAVRDHRRELAVEHIDAAGAEVGG